VVCVLCLQPGLQCGGMGAVSTSGTFVLLSKSKAVCSQANNDASFVSLLQLSCCGPVLQEKLPWSEEVLVSKAELEERRTHVAELEQQVAELTMQTEYQLRLKDLHVQVSSADSWHACFCTLVCKQLSSLGTVRSSRSEQMLWHTGIPKLDAPGIGFPARLDMHNPSLASGLH